MLLHYYEKHMDFFDQSIKNINVAIKIVEEKCTAGEQYFDEISEMLWKWRVWARGVQNLQLDLYL